MSAIPLAWGLIITATLVYPTFHAFRALHREGNHRAIFDAVMWMAGIILATWCLTLATIA